MSEKRPLDLYDNIGEHLDAVKKAKNMVKKTVSDKTINYEFKTVFEVKLQREQLSFAIDAFLRKRGWRYTSETLAYWMWEKEIDGKIINTTQDHALTLEQQIEVLSPQPYNQKCEG